MIRDFWGTRTLAYHTTIGVMKVVPKKPDKQRMKDWRPLTMLQIIYKLIAKLLAECLSPHIQHLVIPQQMGFIKGRFILENISLT